MDWMMRAVSQ